MSHILSNIEPAEVWDHFYALSQIPHPSGGEQAICWYIYDLAWNLGLDVVMDQAGGSGFGNLLVRCPATPGYEAAPVVVFQSHLDMVALPVENKDRPLELFLDGTMLRARGNTLGADNGIAVAMALTLLTNRSIPHGPLELLFTINEEAGMTGVSALSDQLLKGRYLINVDSQLEEVLTVGCAGVNRSLFQLPLKMESVNQSLMAVRLTLSGGRGGHSGVEINSGRINAGQQLVRLLYQEAKTVPLYLAGIAWGTVDNAIPAEACATVLIQPEDFARLEEALARWQKILADEFGRVENALRLVVEKQEILPETALGSDQTTRVFSFLLSLPHGVFTMSPDVDGLVETSSNVALAQISASELTVRVSQRSMSDASLDDIINRCEAVGILAGAQVHSEGTAYGWKPDLSSPLLGLCRDTYRQAFGRDAKIQGVHGMLECALIKAKYPNIDMISFGPTIRDAHAPTKADYRNGVDAESTGERIDTARIPRFWSFFKALLLKLAQVKN